MKKLRKNLFQTMKISSQNPLIFDKKIAGKSGENQRFFYPQCVDNLESFDWVDEENRWSVTVL